MRADVPAATADGAWQLFSSRQYTQYLTHLRTEIGDKPPDWLKLNFPKVLAVAISLDKSGNFDSTVETAAREFIRKSPEATAAFTAMKRVLRGEISAIVSLFEGGMQPPYDVWGRQIQVLRDHGYPVASGAFSAIYMTGRSGITGMPDPRSISAGVQGWMSIPPAQRKELDKFLTKRLSSNWALRQQIAGAALSLATSENSAVSSKYLELALNFDTDREVFTIAKARQMFKAGQKVQGIEVAKAAYSRDESDLEAALATGEMLQESGDATATQAFYQLATTRIPRPRNRQLRLQYLRWLQNLTPALSGGGALKKVLGPAALIRADELLLAGAHKEALAAYSDITKDPRADNGVVLDALIGLLEVSPEEAVQRAPELMNENAFEKSDVAWFGWNVRRKFDGLSGRYASVRPVGVPSPGKPIPAWASDAALLLFRITEFAPVEALRGRLRDGKQSLRIPTAVMLKLMRQEEKAQQVLARQITYQVPPPSGGWRNPPGFPAPSDATKSRTFTSPSAGESAAIARNFEAEFMRVVLPYASMGAPRPASESP